ncbi:MAG TPA: YbfB/YjiJ family MFS transporter [Piscinibacter sp.]|jgi:predicted MFS family arabinose efflux permease|uniref:YbfB/YjiJ family MFS transporter n=1 Tax=Piscinibacter sp. TaxID=1903157 RepID=UPI001B3FB145|nr:YbfB/YjiJ family MFS transporter [Piscinibacter sp.]MBK7532906.1 YbfB/YjiJ family MFS transporter [Piscinibacter sp.]MBP6543916.1 YbfB/YjiJ family MFS transporter [Piscinibacter sp.]HNW64075.1 YbfB/YjiJ family MFS transporter [Piscinibacter sp.]HOY37470.1 YbfB/YjiJ family MFS transporter [Piscinibacter sp.]HPG79680.1 YbfB/YjiJ family MFS transporter [Piscinibacter sp.]
MSDTARDTFVTAAALALGAAISLGLARFSYALLLPPMRADLGWSYFTAGAMNTFNAAGYLVGALLLPRALARFDARTLLLAGGFGTALVLAAHGLVRSDAWLYSLRALAGVCSAATFATGGLLAARLGQAPGAKPALVLGLYYGGTGLGIIASALIVPPLSWPGAWVALAMAALLGNAVMARGTRSLAAPPAAAPARGEGFRARDFAFGLLGYLMFGLGYIGYMTFIVTLLREQGVGGAVIVAFYVLLGAGVIASSWLWAPLLQRYRGGQPLAVLDALLAVATLLPVASAHPVAVFASGALFGAVFLSVVASTTVLVRHNLPPAAWPAGIAAFTIVFAGGQIVGPVLVGWVADGPGGLVRGLALSAGVLALGALLASRQRALPNAPAH